MTSERNSYVCARCGSDRLGVIQRGIDNWPVAQCFNCGPRIPLIPDEDGTEKTARKRAKMISTANRRPTGSQKAIHAVLRPVVRREDYHPKNKPIAAPSMGMFD